MEGCQIVCYELVPHIFNRLNIAVFFVNLLKPYLDLASGKTLFDQVIKLGATSSKNVTSCSLGVDSDLSGKSCYFATFDMSCLLQFVNES